MLARKRLAKLMLFIATIFTALHGPYFITYLMIACGLGELDLIIHTHTHKHTHAHTADSYNISLSLSKDRSTSLGSFRSKTSSPNHSYPGLGPQEFLQNCLKFFFGVTSKFPGPTRQACLNLEVPLSTTLSWMRDH